MWHVSKVGHNDFSFEPYSCTDSLPLYISCIHELCIYELSSVEANFMKILIQSVLFVKDVLLTGRVSVLVFSGIGSEVCWLSW